MSEEVLMTGLSIILFTGLGLFILTQIFRKTLPQTALIPFKSYVQIKSYYSTAISILSVKRWLFILPLCLVLSNYVIKIVILLHQKSEIFTYSKTSASDLSTLFWAKVSFASLLRSLFRTPRMLDYGYSGAITGGVLFMGFFIVCAITFKAESRKMRHYASEDNLVNVSLFESILRLSLILLILVAAVSAIALLLGKGGWIQPFVLFGPVMVLIGLLSLSLFSLIEGFILFTVKGVIDNEQLDFKEVLNNSLSILRPLFFLNVLLSIIGTLPSLCLFPYTLDAFLSPGGSASFSMKIFVQLSRFFGYLDSAVATFTVCAPFVVIVYKTGVVETLKRNFRFIGNNFLQYLMFIGTGILMLFIPSILAHTITVFCHPFSFCSMFMEAFNETLRVTVAVLFYIAIFTFFLETNFGIAVEDPVPGLDM